METYIIYSTMTKKGLDEIGKIPIVVESIGNKLKEQGGVLKGFYKTMGEIDYVAIFEVPNDEVALAVVMAFAITGYFDGTTLKAYTMSEMSKGLELSERLK